MRPTTLFSVGPRTGVVVQMVGDDGRLVCYGQYDARWKLRKRGEMLTSDGTVDLKPLLAGSGS